MIPVFVPKSVPVNNPRDKNIFRVSVPGDRQGQILFLSLSLNRGTKTCFMSLSEGQTNTSPKGDMCPCPSLRSPSRVGGTSCVSFRTTPSPYLPVTKKICLSSHWKYLEGGKMKRLEFFAPMVPPETTHQTKKVRVVKGKPVFYEPAELKAARAKLMAHIGNHAPEAPFASGVRLVAKWCFPTNGNRVSGTYRTTRPDTDNLQKLLKDVMTHLGFWADDALVASEITEKFWADPPGIYIAIEELEP